MDGGLLDGQVQHQEPVEAGLGGGADDGLEPGRDQGVDVAEEQQRHVGSAADGFHALQDAIDGGTAMQRPLGRFLVDASIGERVGERDSELDDVGARGFEGENVVHGVAQGRVACRDKGDEPLLLLPAKFVEFKVNTCLHRFSS